MSVMKYLILVILLFASSTFAAVKYEHPRLYLTDTRMATMQAAALANTVQWQRLKNFTDGSYYSSLNNDVINRALVYKVKQANGDVDTNTYRDAALTKMWSAIEYGTSTGIDGYKLTDSTKNWVDESSQWASRTLEVKTYCGINPDITQSKFFYMNIGYQNDGTKTSSTDTEFYIHPDPANSLLQPMFSPRSEFQGSAVVGHKYVIFPINPDYIKDRVLGVAIAFDWLYDSLTSEQKNIVVAWLYGTAKYMMTEPAYGMQTYHWTNYSLNYLSDLTAIAYAIHGWDTPKADEILSYVQSKYDGGVKESLIWGLQGGGWPEGDGYGAGTVGVLTQFLEHGYTAEGLDRWVDFATVLKERLLYSMHMTLPTLKTGSGGVPYREIIANGDGGRAWEAGYDYLREASLMIINHYPGDAISKSAQTFFSDTTDRNIFPFNSGWEFMFYNPNQVTLPVTTAPLQNAAINTGMVQMRSGWDSNATQATFKCGPKLSYHSHLDATAFTIFKHTDLAPDTGTYPGSGGSEHGVNYFARTIAHNALILHDPAETSWEGTIQGNSYTTKANDGGQRNLQVFNTDGSVRKWGSWQTTGYNFGDYKYLGNEDIYKMGEITKYDSGTDFVYSVGDATSGYDGNTHKAQQVLRKFLYIRPDLFVVYDKIKTKDTLITPKFVLHSVDTMAVNGTPTTIAANAEYHYTNGNTLTVDNGTGRLFSKTLIPASPVIKKIGGRDLRDFWVDGANYPGGDPAYGLWRAEVEAPVQATYTEFLTTLYTTSTATSAMPASSIITSAGGTMKGIVAEGLTVLFSAAQTDTTINSVTYTTAGSSKHIIADLVPGTYAVTKDSVSLGDYTTSSAGTLALDTVGAGEFTILLDGELPPDPPTSTGITITTGGTGSLGTGGATLMRMQ